MTVHVAEAVDRDLPATGFEAPGLVAVALVLVVIGAAFLLVGRSIRRSTP